MRTLPGGGFPSKYEKALTHPQIGIPANARLRQRLLRGSRAHALCVEVEGKLKLVGRRRDGLISFSSFQSIQVSMTSLVKTSPLSKKAYPS